MNSIEARQLIAYLGELAACCRDQVPDAALAAWAEMMAGWRFSDEEWAELKRRVTRCHRGGPVRFFEIEDHAGDLREERELRRNMEHLAEITRGRDG